MPLSKEQREFCKDHVWGEEPIDVREAYIKANRNDTNIPEVSVWHYCLRGLRGSSKYNIAAEGGAGAGGVSSSSSSSKEARQKKVEADATNGTTSTRQPYESSGKEITPSLSSPFPSHMHYLSWLY